jgi:hypothetical protein
MIVAQENTNYFELFSVKQKVVSKIHTCEFGCPNCRFSCKLCFQLEYWFQKKTSGGKGESEKKKKKD